MKYKAGTIILVLELLVLAATAEAQTLITTMTLGPSQIGSVKTAPGITTRISFSEPVKEIICGDLYDPTSGKGSFVIQRSDNDVFLKPVVPKGLSNMFVKTGEKGENVYSLDLVIVPTAEAFRMVTVVSAQAAAQQSPSAEHQNADPSAKALEVAQKQAEEIINNARQQSGQIVGPSGPSALCRPRP
jgi:hypothetical protein